MINKEIQKILDQHNLWLKSEGKKGQRANLRFSYLEGKDLRGANLKGADLRYANLEGANLEGADFEGAYLRCATLERASLIDANLKEANLERVYLEGANLKGAYRPEGLEGYEINEKGYIIHRKDKITNKLRGKGYDRR